jgi:hypothetical protein
VGVALLLAAGAVTLVGRAADFDELRQALPILPALACLPAVKRLNRELPRTPHTQRA